MSPAFTRAALATLLALALPAQAETPDEARCAGRDPQNRVASDGLSRIVPSLDDAVRSCNALLAVAGDEVRRAFLLQFRGDRYRDAGRHAQALADHRAAFEAFGDGERFLAVAQDLEALGRIQEAADWLARAYTVDWLKGINAHGRVHQKRGEMLARAGRKREAAADLQAMMRMRLQGRTAADLGRRNRDGERVLWQLEDELGLVSAIPERAAQLCGSSRAAAAHRVQQCSVAIDGGWYTGNDVLQLRWSRAQAREQAGDLAGAREDIDALMRVMPNEPAVRLMRARYFATTGDREAALADYAHVIETSPSADAYFQRAQVYRDMKRAHLAYKDLQAADALVPDNAIIQKALREVDAERGTLLRKPAGS